MKQYLPSKKFFVVVLSCILVMGGIYGYQTWRKKINDERAKIAIEKINNQAKSLADIDTDGDGLLDWEESYWGSDYKKTDTDGDGTPDEKEIELRRDPLTPGPNDYVRTIGESKQTMTTSLENLTESEKLMRGMLTAIMYSNDPTNEDFAKKVTQDIVSSINEKGKNLPETYSVSQIKTISETSESLKTYGNAVGGILKNSEETLKEGNVTVLILARGLKANDSSVFNELDPFIQKNKTGATALLKLSAPKYTASLHLALINSIENVAFAMGNLKFVISDPVRGLTGMQQYKTAVQEMEDAREKVRAHLENSGIIFSQSDTGSRI